MLQNWKNKNKDILKESKTKYLLEAILLSVTCHFYSIVFQCECVARAQFLSILHNEYKGEVVLLKRNNLCLSKVCYSAFFIEIFVSSYW